MISNKRIRNSFFLPLSHYQLLPQFWCMFASLSPPNFLFFTNSHDSPLCHLHLFSSLHFAFPFSLFLLHLSFPLSSMSTKSNMDTPKV